MQSIRDKDLWTGILFFVVGGGFAIGSLNYRFGSSASPGPAYFPFGLGVILALIGAIVFAKAFRHRAVEAMTGFAWRPLLTIVASVALFGELLPRLGLLVALPVLVIVSALAGDEFHWRDAVINAAILTLGCWAIFVWGLGLIIPLLPVFAG